jgi:carboxymethylenebutenolidase
MPEDRTVKAAANGEKTADAGRRSALRKLAAALGLSAGTSLLPERWKRALLESTMPPAHAQQRDEHQMQRFTDAEQALIDVWEAHTAAEFEQKDADAAIATMTDHPVLTHVPVGTGASGREPLRAFYREIFIPQMPPDAELELLTRPVGQNRVVDEFVLRFTHTVQMDWFAPGVAPTGRKLVVPHVGVISFENGRIASEHIYWDQATVLLQLGLLEDGLPALGADQADRLLDPDAPANVLMEPPRLGGRRTEGDTGR